ncbi:MAG: hypothetical protein ACREF4_19980 [Gammaproteobacteria bacterium]
MFDVVRGDRDGGGENGPVDFFSDALCRVQNGDRLLSLRRLTFESANKVTVPKLKINCQLAELLLCHEVDGHRGPPKDSEWT